MVVAIDDAKRLAIGTKLADMKALQKLLISNEEKFISMVADDQIRQRFQDMLDDDRKNMGVLETVIVQYGVKGDPKESVMKLIEKVSGLMDGSELTFFEKVTEHELLKHKQVMAGLLVHKAAQVVGADIQAAIAPLNTVNFENRAHQEQLKGIMEILGTRELTGQEADQGLWARVQDAIAALSGIAGSVISRADNEMTIQEVLRMDHTKADTLFMEIEGSSNGQKIQEFFGQLYKDLLVHSEAEEQSFYPAIRPFYSRTDDLYAEQAELKRMLEVVKSLSPTSSEFKDRVRQIRDVVHHHKDQEERETFPIVRDNFSHEQQKQMATEFKRIKSQLQDQMKERVSSM